MQIIDDEQSEGNPQSFEVESLLVNVIPSLLNLSGMLLLHLFILGSTFKTPSTADCPFLQGRAFVFASSFAKVLPSTLAGQYLLAAVEVLDSPETGIPVKASAVKSIQK
jgi:importin-9